MDKPLFTVPQELYAFDDERVQKLKRGEISHTEFMKLTRQDDPWEIVNGRLVIIDVQVTEARRKSYVEQATQALLKVGGLSGGLIYNAREAVRQCYPEMAVHLKKAEDDIIASRCPRCQIDRHVGFLLQKLLDIPKSPDRDLLPLKGVFPEAALQLLAGKPVTVSEKDLELPSIMKKRTIPLLPENKGSSGTQPDIQSFRPACINCCRKHLGQAIVLLGESRLGYPSHKWIAVGHLAEASEEIYGLYPELAVALREERLKIMDDPEHVPDLVHYFSEMDILEQKDKK